MAVGALVLAESKVPATGTLQDIPSKPYALNADQAIDCLLLSVHCCVLVAASKAAMSTCSRRACVLMDIGALRSI